MIKKSSAKSLQIIYIYIFGLLLLLQWISYIAAIAEDGEDAFAGMRRAREKKNIKGKGLKIAQVPAEDLEYCLEKVIF